MSWFARLFAVAAFATLVAAGPARALDPQNTLYMDLPYGRVVIELRPDLAPKHVARIKELVRQHFYDGTPFHRVIAGFMAQGGDPTGTGTGGSGKNLPAEFSKAHHVRGTASMARASDPDSADSQFFICFAAVPISTASTPSGARWCRAWNSSTASRRATRAITAWSTIPTTS